MKLRYENKDFDCGAKKEVQAMIINSSVIKTGAEGDDWAPDIIGIRAAYVSNFLINGFSLQCLAGNEGQKWLSQCCSSD